MYPYPIDPPMTLVLRSVAIDDGLHPVREQVERLDLREAAGLPTLDPEREAVVVRRAGALAREVGLDAEDVRYLFWHLVGLSRRARSDDARAEVGSGRVS